MFSLSLKDELRREDGCMSTAGNNGDKISLTRCVEGDKRQQFKHDKVSNLISLLACQLFQGKKSSYCVCYSFVVVVVQITFM